jgi:phage terminase Nu1 subunit (DNA packaging protein)
MPPRPKKRQVIVDSGALVAVVFGVSENTVSDWRNRGMPVMTNGGYSLSEIHAWWREREAAKAKPKATDDMAALELRKLQAEVEKRELQLEAARGALVDREAAKASVSEMFHRVRSRLLAAPEELATSVPADLRSQYITDARHRVTLILREMLTWALPEEDDE